MFLTGNHYAIIKPYTCQPALNGRFDVGFFKMRARVQREKMREGERVKLPSTEHVVFRPLEVVLARKQT